MVSTAWDVTEGAPGAAFANPSSTNTTVTFPVPGYYTLRLTAHDTTSHAADTLRVRVGPPCEVSIPDGTAWWPGDYHVRDLTGNTSANWIDAYVSTPHGGALQFDTNATVKVSSAVETDVGANPFGFTLDLRVRIDASTGYAQQILGWDGLDDRFVGFGLSSYAGQFMVLYHNETYLGPGNVYFPGTIAFGTWTISPWWWIPCSTRSSDTRTGFVGVSAQPLPSNSQTQGALYLGGHPKRENNATIFTNLLGALDEVSLFSRPLTAREVAELHANPKPGPLPSCRKPASHRERRGRSGSSPGRANGRLGRRRV